jgi:hypothetical protein
MTAVGQNSRLPIRFHGKNQEFPIGGRLFRKPMRFRGFSWSFAKNHEKSETLTRSRQKWTEMLRFRLAVVSANEKPDISMGGANFQRFSRNYHEKSPFSGRLPPRLTKIPGGRLFFRDAHGKRRFLVSFLECSWKLANAD